MALIRVTRVADGAFHVQTPAGTSHDVTVPAGFAASVGCGQAAPEELVRSSFEFLLEREPATSILGTFSLDVISRYFPGYPAEIRARLGGRLLTARPYRTAPAHPADHRQIRMYSFSLLPFSARWDRKGPFAAMRKLHLYYGTVKSATTGRHFMAWANSRDQALDLVEAALTVDEPVLGSVVGPIASLPADVMRPGVFVEVPPVAV
jgi:hypothetical protein